MGEEELLTSRQKLFLDENPDATLATVPEDGDPLAGVSGWLGFLVVALIVLGPLATVVLTAGQLSDTKTLYPEVEGTSLWREAQIVTWISVAAFCLISVYAGLRLWKKLVWSSVWIAIACLWIAGPLLSIASLIALDEMGGEPNAADFGAAVGRPFVWALIWTVYLLVSKRVRRTYQKSLGRASADRLTLTRRTRQLLFFSACWLLLSFLYFQLIAPLGRYPEEAEIQRMWAIMLLPPFLFVFGSWAYTRFVGVND